MESIWSPCGVLVESSWSPRGSPRGVLMESMWSPSECMWSPRGVLVESSSVQVESSYVVWVHVESSWSPHGVHEDSASTWSPRGVHVESGGKCKLQYSSYTLLYVQPGTIQRK